MLGRHRCDKLLQLHYKYLILWQIKNSGFKQSLTLRAQKTMLRTSHSRVSSNRSCGSCGIHKLFLSKHHKRLQSLLVSYATVGVGNYLIFLHCFETNICVFLCCCFFFGGGVAFFFLFFFFGDREEFHWCVV